MTCAAALCECRRRPCKPLADIVFAAVMRARSGLSSRLVTTGNAGDAPQLPELLGNTAEHDEWKAAYHRRSLSETCFSTIKRKFGGSVRAKKFTAQRNEVLCKVLAHNLCVLTMAIHSRASMGVKRERVMVTVYTCERCGHRWLPRKPLETTDPPLPTVCAKCRSKYWNLAPGTVKPGPKPAAPE